MNEEIVSAEIGEHVVQFPDDIGLGIAYNLNPDKQDALPLLTLKLEDKTYLFAPESIAMIGEFILQHPELFGKEVE